MLPVACAPAYRPFHNVVQEPVLITISGIGSLGSVKGGGNSLIDCSCSR